MSTATKIEWTRATTGRAGNLESGDRVHEDVGGLRSLLCGDIRRAMTGN
jgi:hypothetical protein